MAPPRRLRLSHAPPPSPSKPPSPPSRAPALASLSRPCCLLYCPLPLAFHSLLRPEIHPSAAEARIPC
jgi:hypothetical protein